MKTLQMSEAVDIPEGVSVKVARSVVTVRGPRGRLARDLGHLRLAIAVCDGGRRVSVEAWHAACRKKAAVGTAASHVRNMVAGVTAGFRWKMRMVYMHFPIHVHIPQPPTSLEIRNFMGCNKVRKIELLEGVTIARSEKVKDELILEGNDIELVSRSAALIQQKCRPRYGIEIRYNLDGVYVSEKGTIPAGSTEADI